MQPGAERHDQSTVNYGGRGGIHGATDHCIPVGQSVVEIRNQADRHDELPGCFVAGQADDGG